MQSGASLLPPSRGEPDCVEMPPFGGCGLSSDQLKSAGWSVA